MKALHANLLMVCSAIGLSHILVVVATVFPALYSGTYRIARVESEDFMLAPARFAVHHTWLFVVFLGIVALIFVLRNLSSSENVGNMLVCGLCLQGLIVWSAAFCFCYDAFTGDMSLHRGPEFEFGTFLTAYFGVFPATLLALLAPITAVTLSGAWRRTGGADTDS